MSQTRAYLTLVNIAKSNNGRIDLASPEVQAFLGVTPKAPKGRAYRLPSYIWDIKHYAHLDVKAVRTGRTVTAYILPALVAMDPAAEGVIGQVIAFEPPVTDPAPQEEPLEQHFDEEQVRQTDEQEVA